MLKALHYDYVPEFEISDEEGEEKTTVHKALGNIIKNPTPKDFFDVA